MRELRTRPGGRSLAERERAAAVRRAPGRRVLGLQRAAGNRAVSRTLRAPGPALQRMQDLSDVEWSSQQTNLAAELQSAAATLDLGKFHSGGGLHAEDRLINALPAAIAGLPAGHYQLMININRSPCSRIGGWRGCAERLMALAQNGLGGPPATHTFAIVIHARNLYGTSSEERAMSALAVQMMQNAGIQVALDPNYFDTGTARALSNIET